MHISRFKFLIFYLFLVLNFNTKTLFIEEAVLNGGKKIGEVSWKLGKIAYNFVKHNVQRSSPLIRWYEKKWVHSKLTESLSEGELGDYITRFFENKNSARHYVQELNSFNKKIESCIPFKKAFASFALPINMISLSPQSFFLGIIYSDVVSVALGRIFQHGKKIESIKPICTHLSYIFQGPAGEEEKALGQEIILNKIDWRECLPAIGQIDTDLLTNIIIEAGGKELLSISNSIRQKNLKYIMYHFYKQIILPFNSFFPIFYILFAYSRFYQSAFEFLKNIPGFSHVYRYVEWIHHRWGWVENELPKLKINGKFICFCAVLYFGRPAKLLRCKKKKLSFDDF